MPFRHTGSHRIFQFEALQDPGLTHAIFTRQGGVSPAPWRSLNVGGTVGDAAACVLENERRIFAGLGRSLDSKFDVWQTHSESVVVAEAPRGEAALRKADAIVSQSPEVTLLMRFADCVPILLFDPVRLAIGLVHAGWKGTVLGVARRAVLAMMASFGTQPQTLIACLGPSIGPDHYQVGDDVLKQVRLAFGQTAGRHLRTSGEKLSLDLWSANTEVLESVGVRRIEVARICTACHLNDWFSHRGELGKTGRFAALIGLQDHSV